MFTNLMQTLLLFFLNPSSPYCNFSMCAATPMMLLHLHPYDATAPGQHSGCNCTRSTLWSTLRPTLHPSFCRSASFYEAHPHSQLAMGWVIALFLSCSSFPSSIGAGATPSLTTCMPSSVVVPTFLSIFKTASTRSCTFKSME